MKPEAVTSFGNKAANIIINPRYGWRSQGPLVYKGDALTVAEEIMGLRDIISASDVLKRQKEYHSGILESGDAVLAWVDHIRSFPIFYAMSEGGLVLSNDAHKILESLEHPEADHQSALEFAMSGFISGRDTLYSPIKCLMPGDVLFYRKGDSAPTVQRYFEYLPVGKGRRKDIPELSVIIDDIIKRIISRADGKPIWVPLSAGLDSRIILCKLHEFRYKNLHSFTYGPRFNFESLHAKNIAKALNVPWTFVNTPVGHCRHVFEGNERKTFTDFADGLKVTPCMREYVAIKTLTEREIIPKDAILINGQSGDYITGGHVSEIFYRDGRVTEDDFMKVIIDKHYSLWSSLKTPENITAVKQRIKQSLPQNISPQTSFDWAAMSEYWEYDARQIVYVINGQRTYEFFGYGWELPLWDKAIVDFFQNVPFEQKRGQSLFKAYLKDYNYKGLFPQSEPYIWRWPIPMLWVLPVATIIGFFSASLKENFYALMRYFGHYANQYACFCFMLHNRTYEIARNVVSLFTRNWFIENAEYPLPDKIKSALKIKP